MRSWRGKNCFAALNVISLLGGRRRYKLNPVLSARPVGKVHLSALGSSASSNSLLSDTDLVPFQVAKNKVEVATNGNILSLVFYVWGAALIFSSFFLFGGDLGPEKWVMTAKGEVNPRAWRQLWRVLLRCSCSPVRMWSSQLLFMEGSCWRRSTAGAAPLDTFSFVSDVQELPRNIK